MPVAKCKRERIIRLNAGLCWYCGEPATTVDHVIPRSRGGSDDDSNLLPACGPCNEGKRSRELLEWLSTGAG